MSLWDTPQIMFSRPRPQANYDWQLSWIHSQTVLLPPRDIRQEQHLSACYRCSSNLYILLMQNILTPKSDNKRNLWEKQSSTLLLYQHIQFASHSRPLKLAAILLMIAWLLNYNNITLLYLYCVKGFALFQFCLTIKNVCFLPLNLCRQIFFIQWNI